MKYLDIKELVKSDNMSDLTSSKRGTNVFTRAILLVGFMLRDSKVAQEVRNQALNIIENTSDEQKTFEITKVKQLLMSIMFATNEVERATAINEHIGGSLSDSPHKLKGVSNVAKLNRFNFELACRNCKRLLELCNESVTHVKVDSEVGEAITQFLNR